MIEAGKGISIDLAKIAVIKNWKFSDLKSPLAVRSFIGLYNYIRIFCYYASEIAEPLNRILRKSVSFVIGPN